MVESMSIAMRTAGPELGSRRRDECGAVGAITLPFDVIPDFIPVAGQFDDAVVVVLTLRAILRGGGLEMIEEHWPGPRSSRSLILRFADRSAKP